MFENFNTGARRSLFFARYEASARNSRDIDTRHMLLGVVRENDEGTKQLLEAFRIDRLRFVHLWPPEHDRVSSSAELPLSEEGKKAVAYAVHHAEGLRSSEVTPLHILLGILSVRDSSGAKALNDAGVTREAAAELIQQIVANVAEREKEERTPIALRASHYSFIDKLREELDGTPSREEVVLAIFDGISANPHHFSQVRSLDDVRSRFAGG